MGTGTEENAKVWAEANKFPFPLLLDPEIQLYRSLGLKRFVGGIFGLQVLFDFIEAEVAGKLIIDHFDGDDPNLNAGDYIADSSGKLVMAFNGRVYKDRPSVDAILAALDAAA